MMVAAALLSILTLSAFVYSLCRIPSLAVRPFRGKSIVLDRLPDEAALSDLLADGDTESVFRLLKALQHRGDIDVTETENEIYVTGRQGVPAGKGRTITRGLLVSAYNPVEDFRHLRVFSRPRPGARVMDAMRSIRVGSHEKVSVAAQETAEDHLFVSDYDVRELLESLTAVSRPAAQALS